MLKKEYVNSFRHNYLKIGIKKESGKKMRYQYQILTTRKLEGLLPVSLHVNNGEDSLFYEISSRQSLSKWFLKEKIGEEWMETLFSCLKTVLWSLEQYLLDERNLILHPDCIFQDVETGKLLFLYCPYYIEEEKPDLEPFLSFLVENADVSEQGVTETLYDIFSKWEVMGDEFTPDLFLSLWEKHREKMSSCVKEEELPEKALPEEEIRELPVSKKKDLTELLFGWHKTLGARECQSGMTMEDWEYQTDSALEKETESQTAYMEVCQVQEERKLYGNGKENRKVINLDKLPLIIGKKKELSDIVLADSSVSRMHARFTEEGGRIWMEDLNATNGTFKNGERLNPYEKVEILKEDEIKLGNLYFTYR